MRVALIAFTVVTWPMAAQAQDTPSLEKQAYKCWSIPGGYASLPPPILFSVALDARGQVTDVKPSANADPSDQMTESAARAIHRCSPYKVGGAGTYDMKMDASAALEN